MSNQPEPSYSKGAFLNVVQPEPEKWQRDVMQLRSLPDLRHVEIWLEYIPKPSEADLLTDLLSPWEILVHGPFVQTSIATPWDALAEQSISRFREAIDFSRRIGAHIVTLHAGAFPVFESRALAIDRVAQRFSRILDSSTPVIVIENMVRKSGTSRECIDSLDDFLVLKEKLPTVQFTLDIGHCLQNRDGFEDFVRKRTDSIMNIHLHDGIPDVRSHLAIGEGVLDLERFMRLLREVNYRRFVTLETVGFRDTQRSWKIWMSADLEDDATVGRGGRPRRPQSRRLG